MLENIKANILRYCDMSLSSLTDLKKWMKQNVLLMEFDVAKLSNPSLRIAQATNAAGQTVCFCTLETAVVIGQLAYNPRATDIEMRSAGASIEEVIAHDAAQSGATSLLMVIPDNMPSIPNEKFIRVLERRIAPTITKQGFDPQATQAARFIN